MTAQFHERLIYEGEATSMACCPSLPKDDPRIKRLEYDEVNPSESFVFSTGCWRNYIGSWEIKDGRLYLNQIAGIYRMVGDAPIFAEWFSGVLRIPRGKRLHYIHMGFESIYEEDVLVRIENGIVESVSIRDNRTHPFGRDLQTRKDPPDLENESETHEE